MSEAKEDKNLFEIVKQKPRKTTSYYAMKLNKGDSSKGVKRQTLKRLNDLEGLGVIRSKKEAPNFKVWEAV